MKHIPLFTLLCLSIFSTSCRKKLKSTYNDNKLQLTRVETGGGIVFNWDLVDSDNFLKYELYSSNHPIPAPDEHGLIDAEIIFSTNKRTEAKFFDSIGSTLTDKYFKVLCRLENSLISSKQITNDEIVFIPSEIAPNAGLYTIPNKDWIVYIQSVSSASVVSVLNYKTAEIIVENKLISSTNNSLLQLGYYNDEVVLYTPGSGSSNYQLDIYSLPQVTNVFSKNINIANPNSAVLTLKNNYIFSRYYDNTQNKYFIENINIHTGQSESFPLASYYTLNKDVNPQTMFDAQASSGTDSFQKFTIAPDGKMTFDKIVKTSTSINTSYIMPNCDGEYILNSSQGNVFNTSFQNIEAFNLFNGRFV